MTFKKDSKIPLWSDDYSCPYCNSFDSQVNTHTLKYTAFICNTCSRRFKTTPIIKQQKGAQLNISNHFLTFNFELQKLLNLNLYDYVEFYLKNGLLSIKKTDETGLQLKLKQANCATLYTSSSDLTTALRFETGTEFNKPLTLFFTEKTMGILSKTGIKNRTLKEQSLIAETFLGVRQNGGITISAALRDKYMLKSKDTIYIFENETKLYIFNGSNQNSDLEFDVTDGFRVSSHGNRGFTENFSISDSKLAILVCDYFKIKQGVSFRVLLGQTVEIDGIKMNELIKAY